MFDQLIKETVQPLLKAAGFKKTALNFYKKGDLIKIINFQKSRYNSSDRIGFYINCGIYSPDIARTLKKEVLESPKEYQCHYRNRISNISGINPDGYEITPDSNLDELAARISSELNIVISLFDKIRSVNDLLDLLQQRAHISSWDILRYLCFVDDLPRMKGMAKLLYANMGGAPRSLTFEANIKKILAETGSTHSFEELL